MDWFDKEASYADAFRDGRVASDIWKYIPKSKVDGVSDAFVDSDGYWIYLEEGFTAYDDGEDCRVIHDYNINDLRESIKTIRKKEGK